MVKELGISKGYFSKHQAFTEDRFESNLLISIENEVISKNIAGKGIVVPNAEDPEESKYTAKVNAANRIIEIGDIAAIDNIYLFELVRAHARRVEKSAIE
jgi:hypothetical protein